MVTLGYSAGPLLVLAGMWALISGYDDPRYDRSKALRAGLACLVLGVALTFGTMAIDRPAKASDPAPAGVSGAMSEPHPAMTG